MFEANKILNGQRLWSFKHVILVHLDVKLVWNYLDCKVSIGTFVDIILRSWYFILFLYAT